MPWLSIKVAPAILSECERNSSGTSARTIMLCEILEIVSLVSGLSLLSHRKVVSRSPAAQPAVASRYACNVVHAQIAGLSAFLKIGYGREMAPAPAGLFSSN